MLKGEIWNELPLSSAPAGQCQPAQHMQLRCVSRERTQGSEDGEGLLLHGFPPCDHSLCVDFTLGFARDIFASLAELTQVYLQDAAAWAPLPGEFSQGRAVLQTGTEL